MKIHCNGKHARFLSLKQFVIKFMSYFHWKYKYKTLLKNFKFTKSFLGKWDSQNFLCNDKRLNSCDVYIFSPYIK